MEATKTREERKVELEKLSATDQGRFELVELLNGYRGQSGGETLPSGTLAVTEILEYEFGPANNVARDRVARKEAIHERGDIAGDGGNIQMGPVRKWRNYSIGA